MNEMSMFHLEDLAAHFMRCAGEGKDNIWKGKQ